MPIEKEEFKTGKTRNKLEDDILLFLEERREKAFTTHEIMGGMQHFNTDFTVPEVAQLSAYIIADFAPILHVLEDQGKVIGKTIKGQMYYTLATFEPKRPLCPKCQMEIHRPKKTWIMTQRPDKQGRILQFHIGLFECPVHGNFRIVLNKQKI